MTNQAPQRPRLQKSRAITSTTAIQTLEITTTAVVAGIDNDRLPPITTKDDKQSHHRHYHRVRSPTSLTSPATPMMDVPVELTLPPSLKSEAIVALKDAANVTNKKSIKKCILPELELFESSFFSAVLLIQWSNVMGPKVEKVWSVEPVEEKLQTIIGRQVLNGEMGREFKGVEPKWVILYKQAIICTAFLFHDPTLNSISALVFVVPLRYSRNFSPYFQVLCQNISIQLIEPLIKLRKIHKRYAASWTISLRYFTVDRLVPFVKSIMYLESVSLPVDGVKTCQSILDYESKQLLKSPFIAKAITSHLQTFGSTLLIGSTLTVMNMVINTLALFLTAEERSRSSHARKNHPYTPDLFLQGLLVHDLEEMDTRIELAVLDSIYPTTLVDMTKFVVKKTPLYHNYTHLRSKYEAAKASKFEENFANFVNNGTTSNDMNDWSKYQSIFEKSDSIAPMVQTLLDEIHELPFGLRESYIRQWRRSLVKTAIAMIRLIEDEVRQNQTILITKLKNALALYKASDFTIVLSQAEKLKPGLVELIAATT